MENTLARISDRLRNNTDTSYHPKGCHLWRGRPHVNGYGQMSVRWPLESKSTSVSPHRVAYILNYLEYFPTFKIPREYGEISHICHNSMCVNINHLSLELHDINCARRDYCIRRMVCITHAGSGYTYPNCIL
jgi:hypothetical protein